MTDTIEQWPLPEKLVEALRKQHITEPSPVQKAAFVPVKEGRDCFIRSQTGSGKTLAYVLPLMLKLDPEQKHPQVLVLVPTRELASQITQVIRELSDATGFKAGSLIGGTSIQRQIDKLKEHPQWIVGTPGRVAELIQMKKLKMHQIRTIVIEEADQMLALDLGPVINMVISSAMRDRQLLFVSATLDESTAGYASKWCQSDLQHIEIEPGADIPAATKHLFIQTERRDKVNDLRRLIRMLSPSKAMIFAGATDKVGEIVEKLRYHRLPIDAIYGDQEQKERAEVIRKFRTGQFPLLVTTDLGSRGLDFENVELVIQLDPPDNEELYIHRAGRTGRMGKQGTVITFVTDRDRGAFAKLLHRAGIAASEKMMYEGKLLDPGEKKPPARRPSRKPPLKKEEPKIKSDRHRVRKNKGAPRWLKDRQEPRS